MSLLIDDVIDFARGRLGGGIGVELTEIENINLGLATVIQEFLDAQPDCKILSNINVSRPVRCDLGRLHQVASNLLGNALTHGLAHSPVKITATTDENDLVLEVWNAGDPIPRESIDKFFEPFWRHSVSASRNGLGLGLHICAQIVRAHEGNISVTSTEEQGTQFILRATPRIIYAFPRAFNTVPKGNRAVISGSIARPRCNNLSVALVPFSTYLASLLTRKSFRASQRMKAELMDDRKHRRR